MTSVKIFFHCVFFIFWIFSREQSSPVLVSWCMVSRSQVFPGKLCCWRRTCWVMLVDGRVRSLWRYIPFFSRILFLMERIPSSFLRPADGVDFGNLSRRLSDINCMVSISARSSEDSWFQASLLSSRRGSIIAEWYWRIAGMNSDDCLRESVMAFNSAVTPAIPFLLWAIVSFSFPSLVRISPRYL